MEMTTGDQDLSSKSSCDSHPGEAAGRPEVPSNSEDVTGYKEFVGMPDDETSHGEEEQQEGGSEEENNERGDAEISDADDAVPATDTASSVSENVQETNSVENQQEEDIDEDDNSEEETKSSTDSSSTSSTDSTEVSEPILKYSRFTALPPSFFLRDPVSTCLITETVFAFGTHSGTLHLMNPDMTPIRTVKIHRASILSLSTDGHYIGSASIDGTVVIGSLTDETDIVASDFKRPVHSIALDPNYRTSKAFISGGMAGKVLYSQRKWMGSRSDTVVYSSNDPIVGIVWNSEDLVIWMCDAGIHIFSLSSRSVILKITRPEGSPRSDLYWPRVHFAETDLVLVAWADRIWSVRISNVPSSDTAISRISSAASFRAPPQEKKAVVEKVLKLDAFIAGVASYSDDSIIILTFNPGVDEPPELRVVELDTGDELAADQLQLAGYSTLGLNDFHLGQYMGRSSGEKKYFVISARDGILGLERTIHDKLTWMLEQERFEEAWEISGNIVSPNRRLEIGTEGVDKLIQGGNWEEAAIFLRKVLKEAALKLPSNEIEAEWERWGWIFIHSNHISEIGPALPTKSQLEIDTSIYTTVLSYYLKNDDKTAFLAAIVTWDRCLYDSTSIKLLLSEKVSVTNDPELRLCLIDLYIDTGEPSLAIKHLIILKDPRTLSLLREYHLLLAFADQLADIIVMGVSDTEDWKNWKGKSSIETLRPKLEPQIELLIHAKHELIPDKTIEILQNATKKDHRYHLLLYLYIERLSSEDPFLTRGLGNLQLELYAEFDRAELLEFIKNGKVYFDIDFAIKVCEEKGYTQELVFLLGKVGQNKKALMLIIDELGDPEQAIEFARMQKDAELWNDVIEYGMGKPKFIKALLENADENTDIVRILQRIPLGMEIEDLKKLLTAICHNADLDLIINQGILQVVKSSVVAIGDELRSLRLKGLLFDEREVDMICDQFEEENGMSVIKDFKGEVCTEAQLLGEKYSQTKHRPLYDGEERTISKKIRHLVQILQKIGALST